MSTSSSCASVTVSACDTTSAEELRCVLAGSCAPTLSPSGRSSQPPVSLLFHAGGSFACTCNQFVICFLDLGAFATGSVQHPALERSLACRSTGPEVPSCHCGAGALLCQARLKMFATNFATKFYFLSELLINPLCFSVGFRRSSGRCHAQGADPCRVAQSHCTQSGHPQRSLECSWKLPPVCRSHAVLKHCITAG